MPDPFFVYLQRAAMIAAIVSATCAVIIVMHTYGYL